MDDLFDSYEISLLENKKINVVTKSGNRGNTWVTGVTGGNTWVTRGNTWVTRGNTWVTGGNTRVTRGNRG